MSAATVEIQRMQALKRANEVRCARAATLRPLRTGDKRIGEVDLDAPELQGMYVCDFLAALRWNLSPTRRLYKQPARKKAQRVMLAMRVPTSRRMGNLTPLQKRLMVTLVQQQANAHRPTSG